MRKTALSMLSTAALVAVAGASVIALSGCTTQDPNRKYNTDLDSLAADMSPELKNTAQTKDESRMDWAVNRDQDLRSAWTDMGRLWLTDRPSALSPYPIMQTNGNP